MRREPCLRRRSGARASVLACLLAGLAAAGAFAKDAAPHRLTAQGRMSLESAEAFLQQGQPERAMVSAREALASDPDAPEVHIVFARLYQIAGNEKKATRSFDRALKLAPGSGTVRNAHGLLLCAKGEYDAADAEFASALRDPEYVIPQQAIGNAGRCAHRAGRWPRAEAALRHALEFTPRDPQLLYLLADTELRQGKLMEARAFVQRRDALGNDAATLDLAARIEAAAGDRDAEARYRQRLGDAFPGYVPTGEGVATP